MPKLNNQNFSHEIETRATAEDIWTLWMDVPNWGAWDLGLKSAEFNQPMAVGATGYITDHSGRRSIFSITELDAQRSYAFATKLPFGYLVVRRTIIQNQPCRLRHDVHFEGIGGYILSHVLGPSFREQLPPTMEKFSELAELRSKSRKEI